MKKLFYSLSALVFVALFMVSCNKNNPKDVADKWLTSFYHMDYEEAKKVSTDETKGLVNTFQELTRSLADSSKQEMKKIQVTIKDVKEDGDKATVTYTTSEEDAKEQKLAMIKKDGKWGVKKIEDPAWLIEPAYDMIEIDSVCIHAGLKIGTGKSMHWKLYNHSGTLLYPSVFIDYHPLLNGLIAVQATSNLWGFINEKGMLIIPFEYSKVNDFENGLCEVEKNGTQLVINKSNEVVFNQQDVYLYSIGLLKLNALQKKTYTYNIDSNTEIIPINADFVKIKRAGKYGLINTKGETILPTIYSEIQVGSSLTTFVTTKDRITKIIQLNKGTYSIDRKINSVDGFYNDFAVMKYINGRFGCIDNLGKIRIAPQYEIIRPFENEVAVVKLNGKWGIVDKNESFVAQPYYDSIGVFRNKVCIVSEKGTHYLMDVSGKILTPDGYASIKLTKGGNYLLSKNTFKGIADAWGKEIISPRYQKIIELSPSLFHVTENDLHGVIDANRNIVLHIKYHEIFYNKKTKEFLTAENGEVDFVTVK